jgi:hypothetical protein
MKTGEESANDQRLDHTMMVFSIGHKDDLGRKALAAAVLSWRALDVKPSTMIVLHFGGYDDDPRELWTIPEVRHFIQKFCAKTKAHQHPNVEPTSRALLMACGADPTVHVGVNTIFAGRGLRANRALLSRAHESRGLRTS